MQILIGMDNGVSGLYMASSQQYYTYHINNIENIGSIFYGISCVKYLKNQIQYMQYISNVLNF